MHGPAVDVRETGAERSQWPLALGAILCAAAVVLYFVGTLARGVSNHSPPEPSEDALTAPIGDQPADETARDPHASTSAAPDASPGPATDSATDSAGGAGTGTGGASGSAQVLALPRSEPTRLVIPALDVDATVTTVGRTEDGKIETPSLERASEAAWYRLGFTPGELGSAVMVGHVDTRDGPGVFYRLSTLDPGDVVEVERADGTVATFAVEAIRQYLKTEFPAREVFDPRGRAGLVLITCGGNFHRQSGYDSNVVAYARLIPSQ